MFKQLLIASLAASAFGAAAQAQEADTRAVTVSVAGIDTHSESGRRIVLQRIKVAARSICGPAPSNEMDRHTQFEPCVKGVTQRAVDRLGDSLLAAQLVAGNAPQAKLASAK